MAGRIEAVSYADKSPGDIATVSAQARKGDKYLTFSLGGEEYGIGILKIKEIMGMMPITLIPQMPDFIKGVINLRGKVIPVIDLRMRFGMPSIGYTERTCIVVVEIGEKESILKIGVVVDSVSEVLNVSGSDIEPAPDFGTKLQTDYILGIAKMAGKVKVLLDIDKVLRSYEEIAILDNAA